MNALFQNAGATLFDYAVCYLYDKAQEKGLDWQRYVEQHDEGQFYHSKEEIQEYYFDEEPKQERLGYLYSKPIQKGDWWLQYYSEVGHLFDEGLIQASRFFKTNVTFRAEYMVGHDWSKCH